MTFDAGKVQRILQTIPSRYRGPGGAVAVLKDGELVGQKVWGYADMEARISMTSNTLIPICSITKQFVATLVLDLTRNPPPSIDSGSSSFQDQMLAKLREMVPAEFVDRGGLTVDNLLDMCSGFRDYWALCTLQGSRPDSPYHLHKDNTEMLRRVRSMHFQPGTEYSYSNTNFNIVERVIEQVTNDTFDNLVRERIFNPAKMTTARMCARTDRLPAPIVGYEGSEQVGFFPAPNYIEWSGDAGMVASLSDMIAYEQYFDKIYTDQKNVYRDAVKPRNYLNGAPAKYRYGLRHGKIQNLTTIGHGGALRGFRLMRDYIEADRLSVVVLFNHMTVADEAAEHIIKQIYDIVDPPAPDIEPAKEWFGSFLDEDTQLSVRISPVSRGKIEILYSRKPEKLRLTSSSHAEAPGIEAWIKDGDIHIHRIYENRMLNLRRLTSLTDPLAKSPFQGKYRCNEIEATLTCEGEDDMLYAMFDGYFGSGPPHLMTYLNEDVWVFADPRAMDHQAPGDWTMSFIRDEQGGFAKVIVGCWLARKLEFVRVSE